MHVESPNLVNSFVVVRRVLGRWTLGYDQAQRRLARALAQNRDALSGGRVVDAEGGLVDR